MSSVDRRRRHTFRSKRKMSDDEACVDLQVFKKFNYIPVVKNSFLLQAFFQSDSDAVYTPGATDYASALSAWSIGI